MPIWLHLFHICSYIFIIRVPGLIRTSYGICLCLFGNLFVWNICMKVYDCVVHIYCISYMPKYSYAHIYAYHIFIPICMPSPRHNKLFTHTHKHSTHPLIHTRKIRLAKIINVYTKCKIIFGVIKLSVFQMLSILEKFSLLLLVKLSLFILFASFLYCSPYNSNSFSLFKAIATSFP